MQGTYHAITTSKRATRSTTINTLWRRSDGAPTSMSYNSPTTSSSSQRRRDRTCSIGTTIRLDTTCIRVASLRVTWTRSLDLVSRILIIWVCASKGKWSFRESSKWCSRHGSRTNRCKRARIGRDRSSVHSSMTKRCSLKLRSRRDAHAPRATAIFSQSKYLQCNHWTIGYHLWPTHPW